MKQGKVLEVYRDRYTEEEPEGKAELIKKIGDDLYSERWIVRFLNDKHYSKRWIRYGR